MQHVRIRVTQLSRIVQAWVSFVKHLHNFQLSRTSFSVIGSIFINWDLGKAYDQMDP